MASNFKQNTIDEINKAFEEYATTEDKLSYPVKIVGDVSSDKEPKSAEIVVRSNEMTYLRTVNSIGETVVSVLTGIKKVHGVRGLSMVKHVEKSDKTQDGLSGAKQIGVYFDGKFNSSDIKTIHQYLNTCAVHIPSSSSLVSMPTDELERQRQLKRENTAFRWGAATVGVGATLLAVFGGAMLLAHGLNSNANTNPPDNVPGEHIPAPGDDTTKFDTDPQTKFDLTDANIINSVTDKLGDRIEGKADVLAVYKDPFYAISTDEETGEEVHTVAGYNYTVYAENEAGDKLYVIKTTTSSFCETERQMADQIASNAEVKEGYTTVGSFLESGDEYETFLDTIEDATGKRVTDAYVKIEQDGKGYNFRRTSTNPDATYRYETDLVVVYGGDYANMETETYYSSAKSPKDIVNSIVDGIISSNTTDISVDSKYIASGNLINSGTPSNSDVDNTTNTEESSENIEM